MYLKRICYRNIGPLKNVDISFPFGNNIPKPLILVGENGSGKSLFLSNIVDSLYEIGGIVFKNVTKTNGKEHYYYKLGSNSEISFGQKYATSYILYSNGNDDIEYVAKEGNIKFDDWKNETGINPTTVKWHDASGNYKQITNNVEKCKKLFDNSICCFFAPNRFSKPFWLSDNYFDSQKANNDIKLTNKPKFMGYSYNPISVENSYEDNFSWLLDVIMDSRIDVDVEQDNITKSFNFSIPKHVSQSNIKPLNTCRNNIELVLSKILGKQVFLRASLRNNGDERLYLVDNKNQIVVKPLNALSTGQMALFNIFLNIIRYADNNDINKSIKLFDISGIVLIDEIDLHLHSDLQYNVLPILLQLFPRVQFIITSHSPLFILGMDKTYGKNNYEVREFPSNSLVQPEEFSQFIEAYNMMKDTQSYREEISAIKSNVSAKPLIITEGTSDWIHIKNALQRLKNNKELDEETLTLLNEIDVEFLEFYPKGYNNKTLCFEMGDGALITMCEQFSKIQQNRKLIFVADHDKKDTLKRFTDDNGYKFWGNNVYSFCIPVPKFRNESSICIEQYYSDAEITTPKKCGDGIERRMFLSTEFNENGEHLTENKKCETPSMCKSNKTIILDGSNNKKIFINNLNSLTEEELTIYTKETNFGLSKIKFAESVVNGDEGFKNFNLIAFIDILKMIHQIIHN